MFVKGTVCANQLVLYQCYIPFHNELYHNFYSPKHNYIINKTKWLMWILNKHSKVLFSIWKPLPTRSKRFMPHVNFSGGQILALISSFLCSWYGKFIFLLHWEVQKRVFWIPKWEPVLILSRKAKITERKAEIVRNCDDLWDRSLSFSSSE